VAEPQAIRNTAAEATMRRRPECCMEILEMAGFNSFLDTTESELP
jgi:hypothetical protein